MAKEGEKKGRTRRRGIYLFPNLLTTAALFAGFYAVVAAIDGNYDKATTAIFVAMLLDGLDGKLARLTGTETDFGKEYDSLSDMVAFGLAPALVVYQWGVERLSEYGWVWGKLGWLAAFLYAVAAALRLARFNAMPDNADRRFLPRLAQPSGSSAGRRHGLGRHRAPTGPAVSALAFAFLVTAAAGALMISRFPYYSFKEISGRGRISFTYAIVSPTDIYFDCTESAHRVVFVGRNLRRCRDRSRALVAAAQSARALPNASSRQCSGRPRP